MATSFSPNLTHILTYLPTGILLRLQSKRLLHPFQNQSSQASMEMNSTSSSVETVNKIRQPGYPSAWAFLTSGYMLGLLLVAFIIHRMQNIILPSRTPNTRRRRDFLFFLNDRHHNFGRHFSFVRHVLPSRIYPSLLPIDISKTTTRLALQLPTICVLTKILVLWCLLVLQACSMVPSWAWMQRWAAWSEKKEMSEICWSTFCAVGSTFCVEGFIRALDGVGTTFALGSHSSPNASPFNLIGYAFLLHIYSSPVTHVHWPGDGLPPRPDKHVIITITLPLLQLTIFHCLSISRRLSTHRLIPTTLTSLLSLAHFHMTLYSRFFSSNNSALATTAVIPTLTSSASVTSPAITDEPSRLQHAVPTANDLHSNYPLLNYIPNMFETVLLSTIVLTVIMNVVVQLLIRGRIERPFIGLGIMNRSGERQSVGWLSVLRNLPWDEDFGVLLLRMSTASLEATGLRGWGNEVAPIPAPLAMPSFHLTCRRRQFTQDTQDTQYGHVKVGRLGMESLTPGRRGTSYNSGFGSVRTGVKDDTSDAQRAARGVRRRRRKVLEGYHNEVRSIDVGSIDEESTLDMQGGELERILSVERRWLRAFGIYTRVLWGSLRGILRWMWSTLKYVLRRRQNQVVDGADASEKPRIMTTMACRIHGESTDDEEPSGEEEREVDDSYARFLRGDDFSEDDSGDSMFGDGSDGCDESESDSSTSDGLMDEERLDVRPNSSEDLLVPQVSVWRRVKEEAIQLFSDLMDNHIDEDPSVSIARMAYPRMSGPLTRQRLENVLRSRGRNVGQLEDEDEFERVRREMVNKERVGVGLEDEEDRTRHLCVICTVEERNIICWPCRCLAICDDCRDVLSSRAAATKHRCPCCRRNVDGYSKIYIP